MKNLVGVIQARMGSKRLPGKVMRPLAGKPLIGHIHKRIASCSGVKSVVLATTNDPLNDPLVEYCEKLGLEVFRHTIEDDIATRLYQSAKISGADAILKINADCPLVDPKIIQKHITAFFANDKFDYISNKIEWTLPEGYSLEIISFKALQWCARNLADSVDRELVANWIKDNQQRFNQLSIMEDFTGHQNFPSCSVDTPEDYKLISKIFDDLYYENALFGWESVREWLLEKQQSINNGEGI